MGSEMCIRDRTYIAKDKRDATFKPDYLDGLVMHVEKGKVYLDGEFVNH